MDAGGGVDSSVPKFDILYESTWCTHDALPRALAPTTFGACRFSHIIDTLAKDPQAETPPYGSGTVNCMRLVRLRDWCLRDAGFEDPWRQIKADETTKALELLPQVSSAVCPVPAALPR